MGRIHGCREKSACSKNEEQPILERKIGRKREEVEADILAEKRVALAVRRLMDEAQNEIPIADFVQSCKSCDDDYGAKKLAPPAKVFEPRRRRKSYLAKRLPRRHDRGEASRLGGQSSRQAAIRPQNERRCEQYNAKQACLGADDRPKNARICDG